LAAAGFDGFVIDDHVPAMIGEIDTWATRHRRRIAAEGARAMGCLQGVLIGLAHG
jgi:mannonate dehydratase